MLPWARGRKCVGVSGGKNENEAGTQCMQPGHCDILFARLGYADFRPRTLFLVGLVAPDKEALRMSANSLLLNLLD